MLIIKVVIPISAKLPPAVIKFVPANCPALVRFVKEINTAAQTGIPESTAVMPYATDTEKYPRQMGKPSEKPWRNSLVLITALSPAIL